MSYFAYKNNILHCEEVDVSMVAKQYGTPCYIYSRKAIEDNLQIYQIGTANTRCRVSYAVKANSNIAILNLFAKHNIGFDIVSLGELERVLIAKGDPKKIIFSGVGKRTDEITSAIQIGVGCFDIESITELERINQIATQEKVIVNIALRVNPNIDAKTHPYISTGLKENKFGIDLSEVITICDTLQNMPYIKLVGLACHIGSQLVHLDPFLTAIDCLIDLSNQLINGGIPLQYLNIGGGLGVSYGGESVPSISEYLSSIIKKSNHSPLEIVLEPGRSLVANTGILLTQTEYIKQTPHKNFLVVDAGMNDLIRPALYDAWHDIQPVNRHHTISPQIYDVVGPVCETADFIGKHRKLAVRASDLLAVFTVGAYGFCMSSNYNSRPRPPEILIDKNEVHVIRERETINDLFQLEHLIK
ncbi:MAG: diaminopimelate decarboxylase [Gammaproteobacteria bacterium]|nr:diaminopimelate decarboxylase [Gammaproteobacteria bacterium]